LHKTSGDGHVADSPWPKERRQDTYPNSGWYRPHSTNTLWQSASSQMGHLVGIGLYRIHAKI